MVQRSTQHATFVIERRFNATPAQVFRAFADPVGKARWFAGGADWTEQVRQMDFRVGGHERLTGAWKGGVVSSFDAHYQDIVPDLRIVYTYIMHLDDRRISVSLASVELSGDGVGTHMTYTEQAVFLDGYDDAGSRERGTRGLFDRLNAELQRSPEIG
ncbi:MAG: SRPBCC family protein [Tahibacter sp.]